MIKYIQKHTQLFFILILLACFEPAGLDSYNFYHKITIVLKAFFILISFIILIKYKKLIELKFLFGYSLFCIYVTSVYFFIHGSIGGFYYAYLYYGFFLIIFYSYYLKFNYLSGVRAILIIISLFLLINYFTTIAGITFPSEFFRAVFFLGIKTSITQYAVLLGTALLYYMKRKKNVKPDLYILLGVSALILTLLLALKLGAGAAMICITIFIILYFIPTQDLFYNYRIILYLFAFFLVLAIPILNIQSLVTNFLGSFFDAFSVKKDVTSLTGRDQIWALALIRIRQNPIFGTAELGVDSIYDINLSQILCHNQFIQLLLEAGILGLLLFMYPFFIKLLKIKNSSGFKYWFIGFLVYHVLFITEVISWNFLLITFLFILNSPYSRATIVAKKIINEKNNNCNT